MALINTTHLKVLLKKDILTLWRNKGYIAAFFLTPIIFMSLFAYLETLADKGVSNTDFFHKFRYVSSGYKIDTPI